MICAGGPARAPLESLGWLSGCSTYAPHPHQPPNVSGFGGMLLSAFRGNLLLIRCAPNRVQDFDSLQRGKFPQSPGWAPRTPRKGPDCCRHRALQPRSFSRARPPPQHRSSDRTSGTAGAMAGPSGPALAWLRFIRVGGRQERCGAGPGCSSRSSCGGWGLGAGGGGGSGSVRSAAGCRGARAGDAEQIRGGGRRRVRLRHSAAVRLLRSGRAQLRRRGDPPPHDL